MKKMVLAAVGLYSFGMLVSGTAFAGGATKVDVCHVAGNGGYQLLSISTSALTAHLAHGDNLPGTTIGSGTAYSGLYGSTVTPITLLGADCGTTSVLRIDKTQNFAQNQSAGSSAGWAGWSCLQTGYLKVVGGGITPEDGTIIAQGPAKTGAAAIDNYNYPVYPNYTFPTGEEGWVVEAAGPTPPTGIYVLCGQ